MPAKRVISKGVRWSIGNGMRTHIWNDKWIPTPLTYRVVSLRNDLYSANGDLVSCLIDHDLHVWRTEVVHSTFLPHVAEIILGIPLSALPAEDRQIWSATPNNDFFMRSAYRIAQKLQVTQYNGQCSDGSTVKTMWKSIWSLKCPNKIRTFTWWACKNICQPKLASGTATSQWMLTVSCAKQPKLRNTHFGVVTSLGRFGLSSLSNHQAPRGSQRI